VRISVMRNIWPESHSRSTIIVGTMDVTLPHHPCTHHDIVNRMVIFIFFVLRNADHP
jgi:hypothetical protein